MSKFKMRELREVRFTKLLLHAKEETDHIGSIVRTFLKGLSFINLYVNGTLDTQNSRYTRGRPEEFDHVLGLLQVFYFF